MTTRYIVGIYGATQFLATWSGDPGRTCVMNNARRYKSKHAAKCAISWIKRQFPNRDYGEIKIIQEVYE